MAIQLANIFFGIIFIVIARWPYDGLKYERCETIYANHGNYVH